MDKFGFILKFLGTTTAWRYNEYISLKKKYDTNNPSQNMGLKQIAVIKITK